MYLKNLSAKDRLYLVAYVGENELITFFVKSY